MAPQSRDLLPLGRWLGAEKRAMPEKIWDEKDSGDKKPAASGYYEKPLGWQRVLLNDLCPSW